jgi:aldehyde:ferredoxin oxidoreductase
MAIQLDRFGEAIAHIDLAGKSWQMKPAPGDWVRKYVGARGLGVRYVLENGPDVEPLSADNLLCFLNGPLTGTEVSMSGRWACITKSPLTGTVTDSHQGGWTGARLRWAGFDGLIFEGVAETPIYVFVEDGEISFHDASDVWGLGVHETVKVLTERHAGDGKGKDVSVNAIGPAGENLCRFSAWVNEDDRAFGRGGTAAVGGVKKLKAIVIKARLQKSVVADPDGWREVRRHVTDRIRDEANITSPKKGGLSVYGTNVITNITNKIGALGTRNSQSTSFGDRAEAISGERVVETILSGNPTCHACPVACKKEVEVQDGPWKGLKMESVEYEPAWSLGANCDNDDLGSIAKLIDQCNDLGMDPIELGNALSMYMEATERGWVDGEGLAWGDTLAMVQLTEDIAARKGVGDLLAEGPARAAEELGHPEIAMAVKGQALPAYDPRGMKGMGLGYATSNRGACHLRGYVAAAELGVVPIDADPLEWKGKGLLLKTFQDLHAFGDSMDLCKFSAFAEGAEEYAQQWGIALGRAVTADEVMEAGERVYNLERHYNNLAGFGAGSDTLPTRYLEEPSDSGGSKGHVCELDQMLEEYYAERGWEDGVVSESKKAALQIP